MLLERGLGVVWVEGELSNFSQPSSGHWYFSLKDRASQVRCAMFRLKNTVLGFTPKAGQQVIARGRVSLYEPRGEYQLIVDHLEEAGVGALQRAVRAAEGEACRRGTVCERAQAQPASLPAADRRGHVTVGGRRTRCPQHSGAPFPAGRGTGVSDRRAGCGRCAGNRAGVAVGLRAHGLRRPDSGAGWRLAGGSVVFQ